MKDFPRAKEGREHTFALLSPFSPCEGGCTQGRRYNDNCFVNFYVLAYKPTPLLRVSGQLGKSHTRPCNRIVKFFLEFSRMLKNFSFFIKSLKE